MTELKSFREIEKQIKSTYYNSEDDTINDFLVPVLKRSKTYKRETYSFSSAIFSLINHALSSLIKNEAKISYIVGFEIEENDLKAIEEGLEDDLGFIEKSIKLEFGNIENLINKLSKYSRDIYRYRLTVLSYLISKKLLEVKIGFVSKSGRIRNPSKFKFHPKVMIFEDFEGNVLVANGSTNESLGAHVHNEESFDVFKSWNPGTKDYFDRHVKIFGDFWDNNAENIKTIDISKIIENDLLSGYKRGFKNKEEIIKIEEELNKIFDEEKTVKEDNPIEPTTKLWDHQETVIKDWFKHGCKGLIKFATGAGKTLTALSAMDMLFKERGKLITVISTPYKALSEQWYEEICERFPQYTILMAYENQQKWVSML